MRQVPAGPLTLKVGKHGAGTPLPGAECVIPKNAYGNHWIDYGHSFENLQKLIVQEVEGNRRNPAEFLGVPKKPRRNLQTTIMLL